MCGNVVPLNRGAKPQKVSCRSMNKRTVDNRSMGNLVCQSPVLRQFPERVVIVTDKNFAGVGQKYMEAFNTIPGLQCMFVYARASDAEDRARQAFSGMDRSRMLVLYYDPGDVQGHTDRFTDRVNAPKDVAWGLLRGSSFYRVDNLVSEHSPGVSNVKKNGKYYKVMNSKGRAGPVKKALTVNHELMHSMNRHFDSLTPLILCCTEDLLGVNNHSCYLGQPQHFLAYIPDKSPLVAGHITTPARGGAYKKGTDMIRNAFAHSPGLRTSIVGSPAIPHEACLAYLEGLGISVLTMTAYDYGLGYVGLESLSRSCLCMARTSKYSGLIRSPVVHVNDASDLVKKLRFYNNNPEQFDFDRFRQYKWGLEHFTPEAVGVRFMHILKTIIGQGWTTNVRPELRQLI